MVGHIRRLVQLAAFVAFTLSLLLGDIRLCSAGSTFNGTSPENCILGTQTGCDSGVAAGLTDQILDELKDMGYSFKELDSMWIHCNQPCVNQLQSEAADSLASAAESKNDFITLNSATRSSGQQYLLYQWYIKNICGKKISLST